MLHASKFGAVMVLCVSAGLHGQSPSLGQNTGEAAAPVVTPSASSQASQNASPAKPPSASPAIDDNAPPPDRAWILLSAGLTENSTSKRATAVRVLSLLQGEARAVRLAIAALDDDKTEVRIAAAFALGELHDKSSIPPLHKALKDKEPSVIIAAANALLKFKDPAAYKIFYAVVTGEMKGGKGLIASQLDELKDSKQMALMGFEEGIGFIPYAGIGFDAYRAIKKDDSSPTRAAAARALANDPDPITEDALVQTAVTDKSELVRDAALTSLAHRGNPDVIDRLASALSDDKESVKYTTAATILHLDDIAQKRSRHRTPQAHVKPKSTVK
jgi:HEAT repeat protein